MIVLITTTIVSLLNGEVIYILDYTYYITLCKFICKFQKLLNLNSKTMPFK